MHLHLIAYLSLVSLAQAQWQKCSTYWPDIKPGDKFTLNDKCRVLAGYPKNFGKTNTRVTVTYTLNWSRQSSKTKNAVKPVLEESLKNTIDLYEDFAKLPAHIVIILTTSVDGQVTGDTIYPKEKVPPCQIKFYQRWTTESTTNKARALQALAHEIYHCAQGLSKLANFKDPEWIHEGSANYFSNLVFPKSNAEWPDKKHSGHAYKPALPIYAHVGQDAYTTSIFFQSLEDTVDRESLNTFVMSTPGGRSGLEERNRLSGLADFTDDFFYFAKEFALGKIQDTSNTPIPIQEMSPVPASLTLDKTGATGTVMLTSTPFTISVFKVTVNAGQTARIYSSANDHQRLAYRRSSDKAWTDMGTSSSGRSIDLPCNTENTAETFTILFISTADVKSDKVKVTVTTSRPKTCGARSGFVLYPLYNPETGGGYCPPKSHSSRLAIWCCPDGTQLDESVASEVSICCPTGKAQDSFPCK
jgi:hypothetical protein